MEANEVEFLAEKELISIVPNFSQDKIYLIGVSICTRGYVYNAELRNAAYRVSRHFGPKTFRHHQTGAEVSGQFGTSAEVSFGHFGFRH